jgi:glycosyltransferase involved in cell wall biosynthesis/FMN phosphatase YigB (HAD superfamily)/tetratricopeptide (TPR) repeat protein
MEQEKYKIVNSLTGIDAKYIEQPIVSFDLFDTLIRRKYLAVNEVHDTVSAYLLARLGRIDTIKPGEITLSRYNTGNFLKMSPHARLEEPPLRKVWERIVPMLVAKNDIRAHDLIDDIISYEFDIELENLFAVEGAHDLLERLTKCGKKIIAISDMYFDGTKIKTILDKIGLLKYFDRVYVSVDAEATKQTGHLFRHVLADLAATPDMIHHIGDNPHSDIIMASKVGLSVTQIDQPEHLRLERPSYGQRPDINVEIADLSKAFLFKILLSATHNQTDRIYFLSRDGLLLRQLLNDWKSPFLDRYFKRAKTQDLFISRATSCWLALNFRDDWLTQAVGLAFWLCHGNATLRQISDLFGIAEVPLADDTVLYSSSRDTSLVVRAYKTAQLEGKVRDSLLKKRQLAEEYLASAGVFSARHITLCDIGYSGTVARDLNSFFLQESSRAGAPTAPKVELELLSTNANYQPNSVLSQPYVHFANRSIMPQERLPQILTDSFAWLEFFFKHPNYGPLLGYQQKDGQIAPEYKIDSTPASDYPYHKILEYNDFKSEDIVLLWMSSVSFWDQLIDPLMARFSAPDINTIKQMMVQIYEDDAVSNKKRSIVLVRPDLSASEIHQLAKRKDFWIPGSIVASASPEIDLSETLDGERTAASTTQTLSHPLSAHKKQKLLSPLRPKKLGRNLLLNAGLARLKLGLDRFDASFYRTYYADLSTLDERALRRHFIEHGRKEGRFADSGALIAHLESEHGPLPPDFDAFAYKRLHGDLRFEIRWQLEAHYLAYGRRERRRYRPVWDSRDEDFEELLHVGEIELTEEERSAWKRGTSVRELIFKRSRIEPGAWLDLLHYGEFQALNYKWAGHLPSRAHAIVALLRRGVAELAPLSLTGHFDLAYYVRRHPELKDSSPQEAYRHWLHHGAGRGEAASEDDRIFALIGERTYPTAFRYELFASRYQVLSETEAAHDRVDLLDFFLRGEFTADKELIEGPGAARLWETVARRAHERGRLDDAVQAYKNALDCGGASGRILHQLADIYVSQHLLHDALDHYERCAAASSPNRWSFINGARLAADLRYFDKSLRFIAQGESIWASKEPWRRARDYVYDAWYTHALKSGPSDSSLDVVRKISDLILGDSTVQKLVSDPSGYVIVLLDRDNAPTKKEEELISAFINGELNRKTKIYTTQQIINSDVSFMGAACIVFHETRSTLPTLRIAGSARALSIPSMYWIGALDGKDLPAFRDGGASSSLASLLEDRLALHFMSLCDRGIATQPAAIPMLERNTKKGAAVLVGRLRRLRQRTRNSGTYIVRLPGDVAGKRPKADAWSTLERLLLERDRVSVVYDQSIVAPREMSRFGRRLRSADLTTTDAASSWILAEAAGYISFESGTPGTWGEATIGHREAALLDVPFYDLGGHFAGSALSGSRGDALSALLRIVDEGSSIEVAETTNRIRTSDPLALPPGNARTAADEQTASKLRVLYANVFFPPQTIGGATRVVKDNVDYIIDNHSDEFQLAALTSDDENDRNGSSRIDDYRGIPVLRLATPQELDMDWRAYNADVYCHAIEFLKTFKPDLVHVHCLQRLSVAVIEACRTLNIPYIVTLHDAWWLSDFSFLTNEDGELVMPAENVSAQRCSPRIDFSESLSRASQLRSALAGAQMRLSVSQSFAKVYESCGFDVRVVANGVSRLEVRPRAASDARVRLAHVGGTQHHKGMHLVEAILRDNKFENLSLSYVDLFRDHGDVSQTVWGTTPVTVLGKIPSSSIEDIYAQTDVLLAPSTWPESFGLVAREAVNAGCWVIASSLGSMGEEVTHGQNGFLVDVERPESLLAALREIDQNPSTYKKSPPLRAAMRTADQQSQELVDVYRSLVTRN